jgi:hydroxymethylpyrimidine/phosphomethylpyrimidine kinase
MNNIQLVIMTDDDKGMLASASTIQVVADALRKYKPACSIVDPVRPT